MPQIALDHFVAHPIPLIFRMPGVSRARAVLEASRQTAIARLLAMLCILAEFVSSFLMVGVSRQLFVPLSLAVGFSMIASYLLSSSLVPVFSTWLLKDADGEPKRGFFDWLRSLYSCYLGFVLRRAFDSEDDDLVEANPFTVWRSPAHLSSLVLFLRLLQL